METALLDFWYTLRRKKNLFATVSYVNAGFWDVIPCSLVEKTQSRWGHVTGAVISADI